MYSNKMYYSLSKLLFDLMFLVTFHVSKQLKASMP